jgi:hypothetical protein
MPPRSASCLMCFRRILWGTTCVENSNCRQVHYATLSNKALPVDSLPRVSQFRRILYPHHGTRFSSRETHGRRWEPTYMTDAVRRRRSAARLVAAAASMQGLYLRQSRLRVTTQNANVQQPEVWHGERIDHCHCVQNVHAPANASMLGVDVFRCNGCGGVMCVSRGECIGRSNGGVAVPL